MEPSLERRRGRGRRRPDSQDQRRLRGLLHDLGHQMTMLSYLVEAVRADSPQGRDSGFRLELLAAEMSRVLDLIDHGIYGLHSDHRPDQQVTVDLRALAGQVARLAAFAHEADVELLPGPDAVVQASPAMLWRELTNVVDNAGRAASRGGRDTQAVSQPGETIVEVSDTGPGFGAAEPGMASLGLQIVDSLLSSCEGTMDVRSPEGGGTVVRIVLPRRMARHLAGAGAGRDV